MDRSTTQDFGEAGPTRCAAWAKDNTSPYTTAAKSGDLFLKQVPLFDKPACPLCLRSKLVITDVIPIFVSFIKEYRLLAYLREQYRQGIPRKHLLSCTCSSLESGTKTCWQSLTSTRNPNPLAAFTIAIVLHSPRKFAMEANSHFTLFGILPTELRFKIWELTIEPRYIHISFRKGDSDSRFSGRPQFGPALPVALQVNRESRDLLLPQYPLLFQTKSNPMYEEWNGMRFNPKQDFLVMGSGFHDKNDNLNLFLRLTTTSLKADVAMVQQMHITPRFSRMMIYAEHQYTLRRHFARFSELQKITVCESDMIGHRGSIANLPSGTLASIVETMLQGVQESCPEWRSPALEVITDEAFEAISGNQDQAKPPVQSFGLFRGVFWGTKN